ncbi:hypothetical protein O181_077308, partial [Austropuccinia psidii MF-1]|nr:hypothetical protein [Austropuccinia psidii MF-1]
HHWMSGSRPMTPELASMAGLMVPPSRSLWVGNLDPLTTAEELMNVFAVYGAIESLRLLPDKQCGFINFVSVHDAIHAKDDIVNRLEGQINLKNGPIFVRIGFGKPESAPPTPAGLLTNSNMGLRTGNSNSNNGLAQAMMMLSLNNLQGPHGLVSSTQVNAVNPNPTGYTNVGGIILGPNGDPILQSSPTRALWVGSIPPQTTPNHLMDIFAPYGSIESARVLTHKNCGFINFEHLDEAVRARKALSGREILGSQVGAIKIGYAKVPVKAPGTFSPNAQLESFTPQDQLAQQQIAYDTLARMRGASVVPLDQQIMSGSIQDYRSNLAMSFIPNGIHAFNGLSAPGFPNIINSNGTQVSNQDSDPIGLASSSAPMLPVTEMQLMMKELCRSNSDLEQSEENSEEDEKVVAEFRPPMTYYTSVPPPINQLDPHRRLVSTVSDPSRLRDIRKRIDSNGLSQEEMDQIANELLEEIVYLSSDYIGNTIVQKLIEKCSHPVKMLMLERCAPHLAIIGCHKNGTWAAQKMIDCASTEEEIKMICQNLRPFGPPLLLDSLGNYVMQCCLRFGSPWNDFVFDSIIDRCWEVAQGRFGARSVRTCLESKFATRLQIKKVAIAVILNSIPLVTNPNGTLLLTWLLDTSGFPGRYRLLAIRLAPHLSHLCTHKLASVTVLRIVNQSIDLEASQMIIDGLFLSSKQVLEEVLGDQVHGLNSVIKILASSFIKPEQKALMIDKIKDTILTLRVEHVPAYKKICEEIGLSTTSLAATGTQLLAPTNPTDSSTRSSSLTGTNTNWANNTSADPTSWATLAGVQSDLGPIGMMTNLSSQSINDNPFDPFPQSTTSLASNKQNNPTESQQGFSSYLTMNQLRFQPSI